jgi:ethanolamine-phosphate cytidylyltransferase
MLDELKCDYCSHGDDITLNENGESCYDEMMKAGRMKLFKRTEGVSTTAIIGRLLLCAKENTIKGKGEFEMTTSAELIKQFADLDEFEKNRKPVMSSFLATSWRITEFSSNKIPKKGDKIIYIDGAFDILHIGHIETLKKAKEMGDFLYVGVHDDFIVNKFRGKNYPILNLNERVFNLLALKYVDEVIIGAPWKVTDDMIQSLKINIVVQGTTTKLDPELNYSNIKPEEDPYEIPKKLGIFQSIHSNYDLSNDILIERLMKNREVYIQKYLNKAKKDNIFYDKEEIHEI